jgi:hypothetical protein
MRIPGVYEDQMSAGAAVNVKEKDVSAESVRTMGRR